MGILSMACLLRVRTWILDDTGTLGILSLWFLLTLFCLLLLVITFVDLEHWRIPLPFAISGSAIGILTSIVAPSLTKVSFLDSVLGLVLGSLPLIIVIEAYYRITHREGMGYGDCFLLGMVGANLGYSSLLFVLFASSCQGIIFVLPYTILGRKLVPPWQDEKVPQGQKLLHTPLPFGPFISLSAMEWLFFRESLTTLFAPWLG
jgi:leader peptidase (prepilin peptidase)/N-methyltransferase